MLSKKSSTWQKGWVLTLLVSLFIQWSSVPARRKAIVKILIWSVIAMANDILVPAAHTPYKNPTQHAV